MDGLPGNPHSMAHDEPIFSCMRVCVWQDTTYLYGRTHGGGVHIASATASFINCQIHSNTAEVGGGLFIDSSRVDFTNCGVHHNAADFVRSCTRPFPSPWPQWQHSYLPAKAACAPARRQPASTLIQTRC